LAHGPIFIIDCRSCAFREVIIEKRHRGVNDEDTRSVGVVNMKPGFSPRSAFDKAIPSDFVVLLSLIQNQEKGVIVTIIAGDFPE
jgi:hypothetical protein